VEQQIVVDISIDHSTKACVDTDGGHSEHFVVVYSVDVVLNSPSARLRPYLRFVSVCD